jgi:hypothetical protein
MSRSEAFASGSKPWDFSAGEVKPGGPVRETAMSDSEVVSAAAKRMPKTATTGVRNMDKLKTDKERSIDAKWRDPEEVANRKAVLKMTPGGASGGGMLIQHEMASDAGYPRGYTPERQREVLSAMSVTSDDIRQVGHKAALRMNTRVYPPTQDMADEARLRVKHPGMDDVIDMDNQRAKAHQAVEDAAAAHVPGKEHVMVSDERMRIGPMEMEELAKALPKTSKKRDTPARAKKFSEMTGKARTVEAIARSTVPAADLQAMKETQLHRANSGIGADEWTEHVPATIGRVLNAPKTHAMIKLNEVPDSSDTLGWVGGYDLGHGPVHMSRASEPKTEQRDETRIVRDAEGNAVRDEHGFTKMEKTGKKVRISTARTTYTSLDNAENQMFYPIPKGTPKEIVQRRREKQSRVTQTLIHELGHASAEANKGGWSEATGSFAQTNTDIPAYSETGGQNPYRAPDAPGATNATRGGAGVKEATAENYADRHWRPDPRFKVEGRKSNYDSRYHTRYGSKDGANPQFRATYAANRIDMSDYGKPKQDLPTAVREALDQVISENQAKRAQG